MFNVYEMKRSNLEGGENGTVSEVGNGAHFYVFVFYLAVSKMSTQLVDDSFPYYRY